ncbi:hypothetical protein GL981_03805 [Spiroplasma citri]|nr:hypothetical protein GL981_03805 [Spiroplasma citri]
MQFSFKICLNSLEVQQSQLFKGDFEKRFIDPVPIGCFPRPLRYVLKDNSKYDKLPSKEEK